MKIGAIKAEVISLMYPDEVLLIDETDEQSLNTSLYELGCNPNLQGILEGCVGSINRCLAYVESRGVGEINCFHLQGKSCVRDAVGNAVIELPKDVSSIESVILRKGREVIYPSYQRVEGKLLVDFHSGIYTVTYKPKLQKISRITDNSHDIYLPCGLDLQIPYYVVADLTSQERPELSKWARDIFEDALAFAEKASAPPCQACVLSVYEVS